VAQGALLSRLGTSVNDRHRIVGFFQTEIIATAFLADRTNGGAYGTTCVLATCAEFPLKYFVFFFYILLSCSHVASKRNVATLAIAYDWRGAWPLIPWIRQCTRPPRKKCMLPGSTVGHPSDSRVSYFYIFFRRKKSTVLSMKSRLSSCCTCTTTSCRGF